MPAAIFLEIFRAHVNISLFIKVKILFLIHIGPPIMLAIELSMSMYSNLF